jgi:hypothetical protein
MLIQVPGILAGQAPVMSPKVIAGPRLMPREGSRSPLMLARSVPTA